MLSNLALILDPQLLGISITVASEGGSDALTTRVSLEITLLIRQYRKGLTRSSGAHPKLPPSALQTSFGWFALVHHDIDVSRRSMFCLVEFPFLESQDRACSTGLLGTVCSMGQISRRPTQSSSPICIWGKIKRVELLGKRTIPGLVGDREDLTMPKSVGVPVTSAAPFRRAKMNHLFSILYFKPYARRSNGNDAVLLKAGEHALTCFRPSPVYRHCGYSSASIAWKCYDFGLARTNESHYALDPCREPGDWSLYYRTACLPKSYCQ